MSRRTKGSAPRSIRWLLTACLLPAKGSASSKTSMQSLQRWWLVCKRDPCLSDVLTGGRSRESLLLGKHVSGALSFVLDNHGEESNPLVDPPTTFVALSSANDAMAVTMDMVVLVPGI